MPKAEKKTRPALNRAYAFVRSPNFFVAAEMLRDQLVKNAGFNQKEAREFFVPRERQQGLDYDAKGRHCVTMKLQEDFQMEALPPAVRAYVTKHDAQKREVTLTGRPTRAAVEAMLGAVEKEESKEIIRAAAAELAQQDRIMSSPAERGERFAVPQMMLEFKGQIISPDDAAWLQVGWHLPLPPTERDLPTLESGQPSESVGIVDVEGGKVITRRMPELAKELQLIEVLENWTQSRLVSWLDRNIPHPKLELDEFRAYLDGVLTGLQIKLTLGRLVRERFELRRKIEIRIKELEGQAQRQGYQQALFGADSQTRVRVGGDYVFNYDPTNYPYREVCRRSKEFIKHYYEQVGDLDDEANREEFQCAQLIDGQEGVEWWVRNLERQPSHSFWLQTSTDKFYPDFVCKLKNEKTLVVEYKGAQLAYTPDTNEKERLGNLWAERSEGQALFRMIRTTKEFERVVEAARIN